VRSPERNRGQKQRPKTEATKRRRSSDRNRGLWSIDRSRDRKQSHEKEVKAEFRKKG
jgi:hypothetical protein